MRLSLLFSSSCALFLFNVASYAQGWVYKYSPDHMMGINGVQQRPDGSYLVTGFNLGEQAHGTRLLRIDPAGMAMGSIEHGSLFSMTATAKTSDGGFAIFGASPYPDIHAEHVRTVLRVDGDGQELWTMPIDTFPTPPGSGLLGNLSIDGTVDGGFFCVFHPYDDVLSQIVMQVKRLDANGNVLWERSYYDEDPHVHTLGIVSIPDGGAVISLRTLQDGTTTDRLFKIDATGDVAWSHTPAEAANYLLPLLTSDGNILAYGPLETGETVIKKLDQDGLELWTDTYPVLDNGLTLSNMVEVTPDEFVGIGVRHVDEQSLMSLIRLDDAGHILQQQPLPLANLGMGLYNIFTPQRTMVGTSDGGFILGGYIEHNPAFPHTGFLIKMDDQGRVYPGLLSGFTFADLDADCEQGPTEPPLNGTILSFNNGSEEINVAANEGSYMVGLNNGNYTVGATPVSPYWQFASCNPSSVELPASGDTTASFGFTPIVDAPYLAMDGYARNRLCMPNTYTLRYCNNGTAPFSGVLYAHFDASVTVDSASVPWLNNSGGYVFFSEPELGIAECRTIKVHFTTPCDLDLMGRTLCIEARALPGDILLPGPQWDSSNLTLAVEHDLATDSVKFTVSNTGSAMTSSQDLVVYEDADLHASIPVQLGGGENVVFGFDANGSTWRGTIDQTPGNPNSAFATVALEGAGVNAQGGISLGFVDDFPLYGQYAFHHTTCSPIVNSWDPNQKTVTPEGIGPDRMVDSTATLDYTLEFQNTGTAEAYVVRIVDTLTTALDPNTIKVGASSHPYTWRFLAHNVVEFLFEDINLPDSTTNEPESHGFVRFRIKQRPGNARGTIIDNEVGIYFDFNPPVITNTATVVVGRPIVTDVEAVNDAGVLLHAYPNPFAESTIIQVEGGSHRQLTLIVLDATGRVVKQQRALNSDRFTLDRGALANGQYVFEVRSAEGIIGRGRIQVDH